MNVDESKKDFYLRNFKQPGNPDEYGFVKPERITSAGEKIVNSLKKEGLTYEDAYASLQYAYDKIRYESNFLKLN